MLKFQKEEKTDDKIETLEIKQLELRKTVNCYKKGV